MGLNPATPLPNAPPRYNAAPSQDLLVLRRHPDTGEKQLGLLKWGLLPHWASDRKIAWKLINARAETVAKIRPFRDAYRQRRCLIPVDGFYEWKKIGRVKQPFLISMKSSEPFTLGGLWENWKDPESGDWVRTFTIITTVANELVGELHDRMPLIIAREDQERWLNEGPDDLLRPYPAEAMTMWPVSTRVNAPKNEGADLIEPVELPAEPDAEDGRIGRANDTAPEPANSD
jgi:putative SOS response-associated peptidase YedK